MVLGVGTRWLLSILDYVSWKDDGSGLGSVSFHRVMRAGRGQKALLRGFLIPKRQLEVSHIVLNRGTTQVEN